MEEITGKARKNIYEAFTFSFLARTQSCGPHLTEKGAKGIEQSATGAEDMKIKGNLLENLSENCLLKLQTEICWSHPRDHR